MKYIISLIVLCTFLFGCNPIPQKSPNQFTKYGVNAIRFKDSEGRSVTYQANKKDQSILVEVGEYWTVITTTKVKFDDATVQEYVKTDDVVSFYVISSF